MYEVMPFIFLLLGLLSILVIGYFTNKSETSKPKQLPVQLPPQVQIIKAPSILDDPEFIKIMRTIEAIPQKVVESVTSTSNAQKGQLGELIGYLHLNSQYDRLIVLRDITDFIGIRFPKDDDPGTIDFIDIKNGPYARLTKDQSALKKLVESKQIGFKKFKVETDANSAASNTST